MQKRERALKIISVLRKSTAHMVKPMVSSIIDEFGKDPFLILISCLLSLRAKDTVTLPICRHLFKLAKTPQEIVLLSKNTLEQLLFPLGFYRKKTETLHEVSRVILKNFNGKVPKAKKELLSLPGVGAKTANLVLGEGFGIPAICVDTHVHRISNRLGLVQTKTADETERELETILPKQYWIEWNRLLVMWGQNICVPVSPYCSKCAIYDFCKRVDVKKSR